MSPLALAGYVWQVIAVVFLVLVAYGVRKARKRGERLFRDEPTARVKALHNHGHIDHRWDAL